MTDLPLHGMVLAEDQWWACREPERPAVIGLTMFDERCEACMLGLRAALETGRIDSVRELDHDTGEIVAVYCSYDAYRTREGAWL